MRFRPRPWFIAAILAGRPIQAQWTYPGCDALSASDFRSEELFNKNGTDGAVADPDLSEPTRIDVRVVNQADGSYDHSDIILVERTGNVKWFDGAAKAVRLMGHLDVHAGPGSNDDNGLMGVALHPDFGKNRWVFLWYAPKQTYQRDNATPGGLNRQLRLSRFTVTADGKLDMNSEKILIKVLGSKSDQWNSGGPMAFDAYGDLWVAVGNNSADLDPASCDAGGNVLSATDSTMSAEWGPSSTASLRGGFFRIHPDSSAKGYAIPRGNFGEYWGDRFERMGQADLAAQYRDPAKVLPELYVKGEAANFSVAVHPTRRWLAWGTVNYASSNDEFNITDHPVFTGYPYFQRDNRPTCAHGKSAAAPENASPFNSGVRTLPPAMPGSIVGLTNVAISGPIYGFDPAVKYPYKFPPQFDGKWLVSSFGWGGARPDIWAVNVAQAGDSLQVGTPAGLRDDLFKNVPIRNFIGAEFGKDGALYITNYDGNYGQANNPGVVRVTYHGSCAALSAGPRKLSSPYQKIWFLELGIRVGEAGPHEVSLYDMAGKRAWSRSGAGPGFYRLADIRAQAGLKAGLYLAKVTTSAGEVSRPLSVF